MAVVQQHTRPAGRGVIGRFARHHFRHFNAAVVRNAAEEFIRLLSRGGNMFLAMAGAMSTAEIGLSLAEMIRKDKIHAICCTGANLEEDIFNLVAHDKYLPVPDYRELTPQAEVAILKRHYSRVTDTCIPEKEAMLRVGHSFLKECEEADKRHERLFPHELLFRTIARGSLLKYYSIDPRDSWVLAAMEKHIPLFVPGWEDSTLGNMYAARCIKGSIRNVHTVKTGVEYMTALAEWYQKTSPEHPIGFFQIGGGIAGDFAICVVPMLRLDLQLKDVPLWSYFCQISDSTTSYGSYSGASPTEKITWEKIGADTPRFVIESDATIVAPLIFATVLGW